ncbi:hypothetical protein [Ochrobactrum soli]|uniref:Uncharacterized protein n=1 Tax=Ochrobactrum soli TaxID=2448455 RepID=A0A849KL94_9HYPH|nr:hypothetical protein [[Ochrobactrum] soli]NNU62421.1 hypothetical protein [[Ochrobactrum] soli]
MGTIKTLGDKAWRDYVTDGVASSGHNKPKKSEIREFVNAVDIAIETERVARISADNTERAQRIAGDQNLQAQIDGINQELDEFDSKVARAEAAADSAENSAVVAQDLVEAATAGFIGFQDGLGYDWGWIIDETTYFDRDWGSIAA